MNNDCKCNKTNIYGLNHLRGNKLLSPKCDKPGIFFTTEVIPSSMGTSEAGQPFAPKNGAFFNTLVIYAADGGKFLYDSEGNYTELTGVSPEELRDIIEGLGTLTGSSAPSASTEGALGQLYIDTTDSSIYYLSGIDETTSPTVYTWTQIASGGGSGANVVQTTGTSTTDVMSQKAVTNLIFPNGEESTKANVAIGKNCTIFGGSDNVAIGGTSTTATLAGYESTAIGGAANATSASVATGYAANAANRGTAIGIHSRATGTGSVAIGSFSYARSQGQMDIGTTDVDDGYNYTNYRLLTGLYAPQSAHDATNKEYVDSIASNITMTSTDPGEGVALAANHFLAYYE